MKQLEKIQFVNLEQASDLTTEEEVFTMKPNEDLQHLKQVLQRYLSSREYSVMMEKMGFYEIYEDEDEDTQDKIRKEKGILNRAIKKIKLIPKEELLNEYPTSILKERLAINSQVQTLLDDEDKNGRTTHNKLLRRAIYKKYKKVFIDIYTIDSMRQKHKFYYLPFADMVKYRDRLKMKLYVAMNENL